MSKKRDEKVQKYIQEMREKIKSPDPKKKLADNPDLKSQLLMKMVIEKSEMMPYLLSYYDELEPYVRRLKGLLRDISEETHICAIYILFCHMFETWRAFFYLIEGWFNNSAGRELRNIQESDMLITLFLTEYYKWEDKYLKKWFSGKLISHSDGRDRVSAFYQEFDKSGALTKKVSSFIHEIESLPTHNGYICMLQLISPFTEDFDFEWHTQHNYCLSEIKHAFPIMTQTNITLKSVYGLMKDRTCFHELDNILKRYNPNFWKEHIDISKEFPEEPENSTSL